MLIVEDIIDTGLTLNYLIRYLRGKDPRSCGSARCWTSRPDGSSTSTSTTAASSIPDRFVVGYGLDYGELYRNLPYIGVLKPEVYGASEARPEAGAA